MKELQTNPIKGTLLTYPTGGYVKLLSYRGDTSLAIIRHLRKIKWLDRASRVVLLELNMINLSLDLILSTKYFHLLLLIIMLITIYKLQINVRDYADRPSK